eukprot:gnl/TRDRNA2_/TRDRNA2_166397_c1_seq3.p1 gnl/TRDRNA2_/TRDRNA2_166397_c1~~gnl/TRDRNA2_/TRDRNA2_166397_c1_seq3.p1  ORF type:complete len:211 (-),score=16.35 gnl/TRDRNA2_/TRDRNA2_166397_c1_seq3:194-826(-)
MAGAASRCFVVCCFLIFTAVLALQGLVSRRTRAQDTATPLDDGTDGSWTADLKTVPTADVKSVPLPTRGPISVVKVVHVPHRTSYYIDDEIAGPAEDIRVHLDTGSNHATLPSLLCTLDRVDVSCLSPRVVKWLMKYMARTLLPHLLSWTCEFVLTRLRGRHKERAKVPVELEQRTADVKTAPLRGERVSVYNINNGFHVWYTGIRNLLR